MQPKNLENLVGTPEYYAKQARLEQEKLLKDIKKVVDLFKEAIKENGEKREHFFNQVSVLSFKEFAVFIQLITNEMKEKEGKMMKDYLENDISKKQFIEFI